MRQNIQASPAILPLLFFSFFLAKLVILFCPLDKHKIENEYTHAIEAWII